MAKKVPYCDMAARLGDLTAASRDVYGNYAHIAGYYETTILNMLRDLPAQKQHEMMRIFQESIKMIKQSA